jgi:hypothetical protein
VTVCFLSIVSIKTLKLLTLCPRQSLLLSHGCTCWFFTLNVGRVDDSVLSHLVITVVCVVHLRNVRTLVNVIKVFPDPNS